MDGNNNYYDLISGLAQFFSSLVAQANAHGYGETSSSRDDTISNNLDNNLGMGRGLRICVSEEKDSQEGGLATTTKIGTNS